MLLQCVGGPLDGVELIVKERVYGFEISLEVALATAKAPPPVALSDLVDQTGHGAIHRYARGCVKSTSGAWETVFKHLGDAEEQELR